MLLMLKYVITQPLQFLSSPTMFLNYFLNPPILLSIGSSVTLLFWALIAVFGRVLLFLGAYCGPSCAHLFIIFSSFVHLNSTKTASTLAKSNDAFSRGVTNVRV